MDILNMTNRGRILEFYKKVKKKKCLSFKPQISNLVIYYEYSSTVLRDSYCIHSLSVKSNNKYFIWYVLRWRT